MTPTEKLMQMALYKYDGSMVVDPAECVRQFLAATFPDDVTGVRVTVEVEEVSDRPLVIGGEL